MDIHSIRDLQSPPTLPRFMALLPLIRAPPRDIISDYQAGEHTVGLWGSSLFMKKKFFNKNYKIK